MFCSDFTTMKKTSLKIRQRNKEMMLTLRIESKTLARLNTLSKKYSMTRSDFVRSILEKMVDEMQNV